MSQPNGSLRTSLPPANASERYSRA